MPRRDRLSTGVYPKDSVDFAKIYSDFMKRLDPNTGSAVSFLGVSRRESADGRKKIKSLMMESYDEHANKALKRICSELGKKYALNAITIVHALGSFKPGDPVVLVALSSKRRSESFKALREAVERYKKEPALFKKELYEDGTSSWIA
jgi:molybdopterin synthase catalytic subunit